MWHRQTAMYQIIRSMRWRLINVSTVRLQTGLLNDWKVGKSTWLIWINEKAGRILAWSNIWKGHNDDSLLQKTCVQRLLSKKRKIGFQYQLSLNAGQRYCKMLQGEHSVLEHFTILSTFIKLPFVIKIFVLSILWVVVLHRFYCITYNSYNPCITAYPYIWMIDHFEDGTLCLLLLDDSHEMPILLFQEIRNDSIKWKMSHQLHSCLSL